MRYRIYFLVLVLFTSKSLASQNLDGIWDCALLKKEDGIVSIVRSVFEISNNTEAYSRHGTFSVLDSSYKKQDMLKTFESGKLHFDGQSLIVTPVEVNSELLRSELADQKQSIEAEANEQLLAEELWSLVSYSKDKFTAVSNINQLTKVVDKCARQKTE